MNLEIVKFGLLYSTLVFVAGFILGRIRLLFVVPKIGERYAELIEMPIMLIGIFDSARFIVRKLQSEVKLNSYLYIGILALLVLLIFEFTLVLGLQGMSIEEYFVSRDPISGTAYVLSLLIYMLMPLLIERKNRRAIDV